MAKFCPLFSGSSGNCTYITNGSNAVLVDAGVSAKRIKTAMCEHGFEPELLDAVFVTHEHCDHVNGLNVLCKTLKIPAYMTYGTYLGIEQSGQISPHVEYKIISGDIKVGSIAVSYFPTSHDTNQSCGYIIDTGDRKIAVCTDLGVVTEQVHEALCGCDLVMLESNHDAHMLQNNMNYPYPLKRRILGECGHLSNNACASELSRLIEQGATRFVLAHLSRENNDPSLARETTRSLLTVNGHCENEDYMLAVAQPQGNEAIIL